MDQHEERALFERGRKSWPELPLSFEQFAERVRPHLQALAAMDPERICAGDLFVAAACLARLPGAVDRFVAAFWPELERQLRRKEREPERLAELRQSLLVLLFVPDGDGAPPRIAQYTGRAPLLVWLRMTAMRLLFHARRDKARLTSHGSSYANRAASGDVELSFIRGVYESDFADALREATAALSDEERLLLQFRYREELTSTQIAVLLKTSRVTAHRRVVSAREELGRRLRDGLQSRLRLSPTGLEQVLSLFSSSLVPALAAELRKCLG